MSKEIGIKWEETLSSSIQEEEDVWSRLSMEKRLKTLKDEDDWTFPGELKLDNDPKEDILKALYS